eukprot:TRINITY_DN81213_c0_g1_i1.p1 TRINITY_DN81213_c0_g1~~TRINITY_DN81213_c0_g1_i1.p1  ORF type:complete len:370 (-),score=58.46 TRINITY_DN81213_c0_g1_i1:232-1341(-)
MDQLFESLCPVRGRGADEERKDPGENTLLSRPFPVLPKFLNERGNPNSSLYLAAEEAILQGEEDLEHVGEAKLCGRGLEEMRQLLADEPEPDWSSLIPWEELSSRPAPLHEVVQAMEISKYCSQRTTETGGELNFYSPPCGQSMPHSAQMKRPSSASCSTRVGSSRPSSAGSSRPQRSSSARAITNTRGVWPAEACGIRKTVPPKGPVPKERYRIPRHSNSNKPPAPACQAASPALSSRQRLLMQKQHSVKVWTAHAAAAAANQQPTMAEPRRCAAFSAVSSMQPRRPGSAAEGLRRSLQQQARTGQPTFRPSTPRAGGQPPRVGSAGRGPVKAFASAANPRMALLEAARCHAPRAPSSRPSTAGTVRK